MPFLPGSRPSARQLHSPEAMQRNSVVAQEAAVRPQEQRVARPAAASSTAPPPIQRPSSSHTLNPTSSVHDTRNGHVNGSSSTAPAKPQLLRAKSDFGPRREEPADHRDDDSKSSLDGDFKIRHGFDSQLESADYNDMLNSVSSPSFRSGSYLKC
jgi:regulatory associated protein of mTOR